MPLTELVPIPGGSFRMGSDHFYPEERPVHERTVAPFVIERHPVTNAQFAEFVSATGYLTVAEQAIDPRDFPDADPDLLVAGALVFTPTSGPVDLRDWRRWWRWQPGATWRHPGGPGTDVEDRPDHPVVHIAHRDAIGFAQWAGRRLPSEAEWEFAAAGGRFDAPYPWGTELHPGGQVLANTWLGRFPYENLGRGTTSPVGSYPANGYGLYDMIGNVWERVSDLYTPRHVPPDLVAVTPDGRSDLLAPDGAPADTDITGAEPTTIRVTKGGSHLCSPDYCRRYRPAARSPQSDDSATSHLGFRCAA